MSSNNPWDNLAEYFNTSSVKPKDEIESNAADNVFISEPIVLKIINEHLPKFAGQRALDFGCGTGAFTAKVSELGFDALGIDSSEAMIKIASRLYGTTAAFKTGDSSIVVGQGTFRLITSLMTLQFIENVDRTIERLAAALQDDGLMIIGVFNPAYARNAFEAKQEFFGFDFSNNPTQGTLEMTGDDKVPTFIRDAHFYKEIAEQAGLSLVAEVYPPFTTEFLEQYPHPVPTKDPEYMILGFKGS